jgi:hypothetical protein
MHDQPWRIKALWCENGRTWEYISQMAEKPFKYLFFMLHTRDEGKRRKILKGNGG